MGLFHARDLGRFVEEVDRRGGLESAETAKFLTDFAFDFSTRVDQNLDPFSEEYFQAQVALYTELSGRPLNQQLGELNPATELQHHVNTPNPFGMQNPRFLARHTRAITTCMMMANLPDDASILDAGCGFGLSTEAMAQCGARVTALDISPYFADLVRQRAARLGLPIEVVCSTFDAFQTDNRFDLIVFYECLHHSLKPWETVEHLGKFLKPDGKIFIAGEPIQNHWWKHWGLRLDPGSLYCIRKCGWWESGWSAAFIQQAFTRAGFDLAIYPYIGLDNGLIGAAVREPGTHKQKLELSVLAPYNDLHNPWHQQLAAAHQEIADMRASRSWRITTPLRSLFRVLGWNRSNEAA